MAKGRKTGGRVKGSIPKKTLAVQEKLAKLKCDPIEGMARIAKQAEKAEDWALAGQMFKELAQYVAPKRKAIEVTGEGGEPLAVSVVSYAGKPEGE